MSDLDHARTVLALTKAESRLAALETKAQLLEETKQRALEACVAAEGWASAAEQRCAALEAALRAVQHGLKVQRVFPSLQATIEAALLPAEGPATQEGK